MSMISNFSEKMFIKSTNHILYLTLTNVNTMFTKNTAPSLELKKELSVFLITFAVEILQEPFEFRWFWIVFPLSGGSFPRRHVCTSTQLLKDQYI